jgi:hypothetical protein|tara:strand:+ start:122 stop:709 length:588 start_codon:yes stop_codon:yes gene_type:complete
MQYLSYYEEKKIMAKINVKLPKNLNVTVTDELIEKRIKSVNSKVKNVNNEIQLTLTTIMLRWHQSGDVATACRFMNTLVIDLDGTAVRSNAIKAWIQAYCGFNWVQGDDGKSLFTYNKKRSKVSYDDVVTAHQNMWSTFTKEPEYKPVISLDDINALKKKWDRALEGSTKDAEKHKNDDIDMELYNIISRYLMTK